MNFFFSTLHICNPSWDCRAGLGHGPRGGKGGSDFARLRLLLAQRMYTELR